VATVLSFVSEKCGIGVGRIVDCRLCATGLFGIACVFGISIILIGVDLIANGFEES